MSDPDPIIEPAAPPDEIPIAQAVALTYATPVVTHRAVAFQQTMLTCSLLALAAAVAIFGMSVVRSDAFLDWISYGAVYAMRLFYFSAVGLSVLLSLSVLTMRHWIWTGVFALPLVLLTLRYRGLGLSVLIFASIPVMIIIDLIARNLLRKHSIRVAFFGASLSQFKPT